MAEPLRKPYERIPYYELPLIADGGSVKTFDKKIFQVRGIVVRDTQTDQVCKLSTIYYQIRTVQNKRGQVIAKRKNPTDELIRVN